MNNTQLALLLQNYQAVVEAALNEVESAFDSFDLDREAEIVFAKPAFFFNIGGWSPEEIAKRVEGAELRYSGPHLSLEPLHSFVYRLEDQIGQVKYAGNDPGDMTDGQLMVFMSLLNERFLSCLTAAERLLQDEIYHKNLCGEGELNSILRPLLSVHQDTQRLLASSLKED